MKRWLFLALLLFTQLQALTLSEQLANAQTGDYLVTYQSRTYTVLLVRAREGDRLIFEEISVPRRRGGGVGCPWPTWVSQGAPGHTSWLWYTVDIRGGEVLNTYSFTRRGWVSGGASDQFLSTLLRLNFSALPPEQRKRTGRGNQIWQPPLAFEGQRCSGVTFDAYKAQWPKDGSPIAGKTVTIYLPDSEGPYPAHFPYWIELTPAPIEQKIRVVDSGRGLASPRKDPR